MKETIQTLTYHARQNAFALFLVGFVGAVGFGLFALFNMLQSFQG
jgi:hypothetical protein